jgi:hypothetical protein
MFCSGFEDPYKCRNSIHMYVLNRPQPLLLVDQYTYLYQGLVLVSEVDEITDVSFTNIAILGTDVSVDVRSSQIIIIKFPFISYRLNYF